ncbi:MAG TPA: nucleotidyltransferase domain-containing protein [Polyangiaceae bacterium]|nr:nucleotidyltransferase domain-containing protein [Polyangiaceae bacterium]
MFGSVARREEQATSDVDVLVRSNRGVVSSTFARSATSLADASTSSLTLR